VEVLTISEFLARKAEPLSLSVLTEESTLQTVFRNEEVMTPGLALAGFTDRFTEERAQVLGETEIAYLGSLDPPERDARCVRHQGTGSPATLDRAS
jgi:serine kinase of HPr protein (carbohydrate metabolism regulator)